MRHADHDVAQAKLATAFDDLFHRRDQAFATIQTEPLCAHVLNMQELLEAFRLHEAVQDRLAPVLGKGNFLAQTLNTFFQPCGFLRVGNVHVLQRKRAAIGPLHDGKDVFHRRHFEAEHIVDKDRAIHVFGFEPVGRRIEFGVWDFIAHAEWVKVGHKMPPDPVGADDHQRADRIQHGVADLFFGNLNAL